MSTHCIWFAVCVVVWFWRYIWGWNAGYNYWEKATKDICERCDNE